MTDADAPLRIGLIAADLTHQHGWAHYSLSLIRALRRANVELTVLTTHDSPIPPDIHALPLLPSVSVPERGLLARLLAALPAAQRALRGCALVHALIEPFAPLAALLAGGRPLFVTAHGSYIRVEHAYAALTRPLYRWSLGRATLISVSRYTAAAARRSLPRAQTVVVPNGVDGERFAGIERTNAPRPPTILSVGALKRRKGALELVRAFAAVRQAHPNARLHLVGALDLDPAYVADVRAAVDHGALVRGDLAASVTLAGRISDAELRRAYAEADIFALPSLNDGWRFEGFGLALLEASAAGLPVIGSRDCGAEDAVQDGVTGLLVPQADVDALAGALRRLLNHPDDARRMGEAGRAFAAAQTWDAAAAQIAALYQKAVG
jgi:glycosyltransferase involved in cell wall biosynthesis